MQDLVTFGYVPKYNMSKGLDQLKDLSEDSQIKFYRMYLGQMNDLSIYILILKKVLYRMGSLGAITNSSLQNVLVDTETYEEENLPVREDFRTVSFREYKTVVLTVLQRMVNLLGLQGDNCQATFHHRFIMSSKNPQMLAQLSLDIMKILEGEPFLKSDNATKLKSQIESFMGELKQELE